MLKTNCLNLAQGGYFGFSGKYLTSSPMGTEHAEGDEKMSSPPPHQKFREKKPGGSKPNYYALKGPILY